jgi:hypothetical protein
VEGGKARRCEKAARQSAEKERKSIGGQVSMDKHWHIKKSNEKHTL